MDQDTLFIPSAPTCGSGGIFLTKPQGQDRGAAGQGGIRCPRQYLVDASRPIHRGGQGQQGPALQQDAAHTPLAAGNQDLSVGQTCLENHLGILKEKEVTFNSMQNQY